MIFDILQLDGEDLTPAPYIERRKILTSLRLSGSHWRATHAYGNGAELFETARQHVLEGVVCKRLTSPYRPGERCASWIKVKNRQAALFTIVGWIGDQNGRIEALLVGETVPDGTLTFLTAVVEGGGQCGLVNYRTLCFVCHKNVSAKQAKTRAEQRRLSRNRDGHGA
jgi:bifunctional non-homologous end joining protein LigD